MILLEDFAEPLTLRRDDDGVYVVGGFPQVTLLVDELLEPGALDALERTAADELHVWCRNGHAAYRIVGPATELRGAHVLQRKGR